LQASLAEDGLHPNAAGYKIMAPLALAAIDHALRSPAPPAKKKRFGIF
jgi:lysophospholipase L1-like esterase